MQHKINYFTIAATFVGTAIGAGFVSGQEIMQFFANYGHWGIFGAFLTGIGFSVLSIMVMLMAYKKKSAKFDEVAVPNIKFLQKFIHIFITLLNYGIFIIMLAGAGSMFYSFTGVSVFWGSLLMGFLVFATGLCSADNMLNNFSFLVPVMVVIALITSVLAMGSNSIHFNFIFTETPSVKVSFFTASLLFLSYNMATVTSVLVPIAVDAKNKSAIIKAGILGGTTLGALAMILTLAMIKYYPFICKADMPMLELAKSQNKILSILYSFILLIGIFTTAEGVLFAVLERLKEYPNSLCQNRKLLLSVLVIGAVLGANIGFTSLIKTVYPLSGYVGFVLIGCILYNFLQWKKKQNVLPLKNGPSHKKEYIYK